MIKWISSTRLVTLLVAFLVIGALIAVLSYAYFIVAPHDLRPHLRNGMVDPYGAVDVMIVESLFAVLLSMIAAMIRSYARRSAGGGIIIRGAISGVILLCCIVAGYVAAGTFLGLMFGVHR